MRIPFSGGGIPLVGRRISWVWYRRKLVRGPARVRRRIGRDINRYMGEVKGGDMHHKANRAINKIKPFQLDPIPRQGTRRLVA
jgi:hypothetical protein